LTADNFLVKLVPMNDELKISVEIIKKINVITPYSSAITGMVALEINNCDDFIGEIEQKMNDISKFYIINLSKVNFIDSSGLSGIVTIHQECAKLKGRLALAGPQGSVRKVLDVTQISKMLDVFDNVKEAVASFH
jgi:anti-sigma B factor antagonist